MNLNPFAPKYATGLEPETFAGKPTPAARLVELEPVPMPTLAHTWPLGPVLNQGTLGACGAFSTVAELIADPQGDRAIAADVANAYAVTHYQAARVADGRTPMPAPSDPVQGSSVSANLRVDVERGFAAGYRRLASVEDLAQTIVNDGPVVLALRWLPCFERTDASGLMRYEPSPEDRGYHAVLAFGYDPALSLPRPDRTVWERVKGRFKHGKRKGQRRRGKVERTIHQTPLPAEPMIAIRNSWGTSWGQVQGKARTGTAWLRLRDLRHLWDAGEAYAYVPTDRMPVDLAAWLAAQQPATS